MPLGQLRNVHQTLDALLDANERAKWNQLGDLPGNDLTDLMRASKGLPRIFLSRLERQRNTLAVHVNVEHLDGDFLTHFDYLGGVVDVLPGELRDVHQPVDTAKIDKSAEVDDGRHDATPNLAFLQLSKEILANLGLCLLQPGAAREHDVITVLVQLDDLGLELHADIRLQITSSPHLHPRSAQDA